MIKALFKFTKIPHIDNLIVVDVTSSSGQWRELSPFILPAAPAKRFENLWQFSKVYKQHLGKDGYPSPGWFVWRELGFKSDTPFRYPMGKGAIPEYSFWKSEKLSYLDARKRIYIPEYAKNVRCTDSYKRLEALYQDGKDLILLDYDAYDHQAMGASLQDVINNPKQKMGHAFVLIMMLTGFLP